MAAIMPPWLQAILDEQIAQNSGAYNPTSNAPPPRVSSPNTAAPTGQVVQGADMADVFAQLLGGQITNQATQASARNQTANDLLFGRHLGVGGGQMTPSNPTGDPRDPFNNPAFFAGNPVDRAAKAIQAGPLQPATGYGPGQVGPTPDVAEPYAPPTAREQAAFDTRPFTFNTGTVNQPNLQTLPYSPPVKRYIPPPPPPPPPSRE